MRTPQPYRKARFILRVLKYLAGQTRTNPWENSFRDLGLSPAEAESIAWEVTGLIYAAAANLNIHYREHPREQVPDEWYALDIGEEPVLSYAEKAPANSAASD